MSPRELPPTNLRVRIVGKRAQQALYTNREYIGQLWYADASTPKDDQYWYIIPNNQSNRAGTVQIQSTVTHQNLCMNPSWMPGEGNVGTSAPEISKDDQAIRLVPGTDENDGFYRFERPDGSDIWKLYCRDTFQKPTLGCVKLAKEYGDQWFSFVFEPLQLVTVDYDLQHIKILDRSRPQIYKSTTKGGLNTSQTMVFEINEVVTHESSWEFAFGGEFSQEEEGEVRFPMLAEGKAKITASLKAGVTRNTTNTTQETIKRTETVTCEAHKTVQFVATMDLATIEVPSTLIYKSKKTGEQIKLKGTYMGKSYSDYETATVYL